MKHGDAVQLVRNGTTQNALVFLSSGEGDAEQLTVVYFDPLMPSSRQAKDGLATAFNVPKLKQGAMNGWYAGEDHAPSSADLDTVAEEQKAAEATAGADPEFSPGKSKVAIQ